MIIGRLAKLIGHIGFITNAFIEGCTIGPPAAMEYAVEPVEEEMISEALQKANYKSAIIGKWHMGTHPRFHPLKQGWDYFFGFLTGGHNYFPEKLIYNDFSEVKWPYGWYSMKLLENYKRIDIDDYLTDELSDAAVRYIKKQVKANQKFLVYLSYNAPHAPLQATSKYLERFPEIENKRRKKYAAMVSAMDDGVGRVMNAIKSAGQEENTIVVFLSDNGGPVHKNGSKNFPLRGGKSDLYEGGIRVPFAMQWKGKIKKGMEYNYPVSSMDIMGTICEIAGVKTKNKLDGVNLLPFLKTKNKAMPHDVLFWRKWEQNAMAIRSDKLKLVANRDKSKTPPALYNLEQDLVENYNLRESNKTEVTNLMSLWEQWDKNNKERYFPTLREDKWWERNSK